MKYQHKKRIIQKLWGWICMAFNCMIITIFLADKVTDFLNKGILLSFLIILYGIGKLQADKAKNDRSGISVVIEYICIFAITLLCAFRVSDYLSSLSVLIVSAISCSVEFVVFLLITYWHTIRRLFLRMGSNSS